MCIGKPECQRCETCGNRKYQFWVSAEMHDRGCPWGHDRMTQCNDAINSAKVAFWGRENGIKMTPAGIAKIEQFEAAGVDLTAPPVEGEGQ